MRTHRPEVSNSEDTLDSRDVIARIRELEDERSDLESTLDECKEKLTEAEESEAEDAAQEALSRAEDALQEWDADYLEELEQLKKFEADAEGYGDWRWGAQLIRDSYFETYARSTAEESHNVSDARWPFSCIDWEKAADELKQDYTSVEFDGVTYWMRS